MNVTSSEAVRKTRVLVADDHPLFRQGLASLIDRQGDLVCCGEADSAVATLQAFRELKPELVVLDLRLGHADGLQLIRTLKAEFPQVPILVVSQFEELLYSERALRAGAHGYVMKEEATEEVLTAIRCILAGELFVSRKVAATVLRKHLQPESPSRQTGVEVLSDRELQVFGMLGDGLSTRQIAAQLNLSLKTVESHRESIKHKLGHRASATLVRDAVRWRQSQSTPGGAVQQSSANGSEGGGPSSLEVPRNGS